MFSDFIEVWKYKKDVNFVEAVEDIGKFLGINNPIAHTPPPKQEIKEKGNGQLMIKKNSLLKEADIRNLICCTTEELNLDYKLVEM